MEVLTGPTVPTEVVLDTIRCVARRVPALDATIRCADDAERLLADGRADVGFLRAPLDNDLLSQTVVASEARVALVPREHPLAHRDEVELDALRGEEVLEPPAGGLGVGRRTGRFEELLARVAGGRAVAIVPQGLFRGSCRAIVAVALRDAPPSAIVLAHRPVARSAAAVAFVDAALQVAPAEDRAA